MTTSNNDKKQQKCVDILEGHSLQTQSSKFHKTNCCIEIKSLVTQKLNLKTNNIDTNVKDIFVISVKNLTKNKQKYILPFAHVTERSLFLPIKSIQNNYPKMR